MHTHYIRAGGLRALQFTNGPEDAILASELVGAAIAVEVDYVGPELAPVLRVQGPGGEPLQVPLGAYLIVTDDGEVGEISADEFRAAVAPMPVADAAPARGRVPHPPLDVEHVFTYHEGHPDDGPRYDALRTHAKAFARAILDHVPTGADQAAAFRQVREALATAIAGVVLGRPSGTRTPNASIDPAGATPDAPLPEGPR